MVIWWSFNDHLMIIWWPFDLLFNAKFECKMILWLIKMSFQLNIQPKLASYNFLFSFQLNYEMIQMIIWKFKYNSRVTQISNLNNNKIYNFKFQITSEQYKWMNIKRWKISDEIRSCLLLDAAALRWSNSILMSSKSW